MRNLDGIGAMVARYVKLEIRTVVGNRLWVTGRWERWFPGDGRPTTKMERIQMIRILRHPRYVGVAFFAFLCVPIVADAQTYDVIIRNGRVLDGSGNPWLYVDIAIDGDRIAAVGNLAGATGHREIDATGLYVAPGFIDPHSHAAGGLSRQSWVIHSLQCPAPGRGFFCPGYSAL